MAEKAPLSEAEKIYAAVFGGRIPDAVEQHWNATPDSVFPPISTERKADYERVIAEVRDLEALEFASRLRGRNQLLSLKFQLMVHHAECNPESRSYLINDHDQTSFRTGWLLFLNGWHCLFKLLKGLWILRRYGGN